MGNTKKRKPLQIARATWIEGKAHWTCDACKTLARWGEDWAQYGTMDEPEFITCSDACRAVLEEKYPFMKEGK